MFKTMTRRKQRWGRRVSAALAIVWLTSAFQPCVMAAAHASVGLTGEAQSVAHLTRTMHAPVGKDPACPHCVTMGEDPCQTAGAGSCDDDGALQAGSEVKSKEGPQKLLLPAHTLSSPLSLQHAGRQSMPSACSETLAAGPPLNILLCVYLK